MSTRAYHLDINWPETLLSAALASGVSTFLLAGDVPPNLSDIVIGVGVLVGAQMAANFILHNLATRHKN